MAQFLADECTFTSTVNLIRDLGLPVQRIQELGMIGAEDTDVFTKAQELQATLVTNDQGFGDVRTYPPSTHHGVIVLKVEPDPMKVEAVHKILRELVNREQQFTG